MKFIVKIAFLVGLTTALSSYSYGQRFATLYTVTNDNPIGLAHSERAMYGTTFAYGGAGFNCGMVFELQPPSATDGQWVGSALYDFPSVFGEACSPAGAATIGTSGSLYGLTSGGGTYLFGVLYELQPPNSPDSGWSENVLYTFGAPGSGIGYPASGLVEGPGGSFYILTSNTNSTPPELCQLQPPASPSGAWTATVLYSFPSGTAAVPLNSLVAGPNGVLYGTNAGGPGAVFQLTPPDTASGAWTKTVLHRFSGAVDNPIALTVAADGTIYGTAYGYNPPLGSGASAVFRLTPPSASGGQWAYKLLTTPVYAEHFNTPLALANDHVYGGITTGAGGSIFELTPPSSTGASWTMTTLHTFTNGQAPSGNLVATADGTIFGTTASVPGQPSGGTVYAIATK